MLSGQVALSFATAPSAVPHVKGGKLKVLGVSARQRIHALPEVPTMTEAGLPGYEASNYHGVVAPAGVPKPMIDRIHASIVRTVNEPAMSKYLSEQGADPITNSPGEYAAWIRSEVVTWSKVVRESGAKVD